MNVLAKLMNSAATETAHVAPASSSDPRDRLPPEKRAKLLSMEDQADALHGAIPTRRQADLFERLAEIRQQRARFLDGVQYAGRRPEDQERLAEFDARLEKVQAELARISEVHAAASEAWNRAGNVVKSCLDFLNEGHSPLRAARTAEPKIAAGQNLADEVARVRDEIEQVAQERENLDRAPVPAKELAARMVVGLDQIAAKGKPSVKRSLRGGDPLQLDQHLTHPAIATAFLLFLFRDEVADRLVEFIGPDAPGALTDAERAKKLAATDAKLLELERREEALIVMAANVGQRIDRRLDADPRAILEIE